MFFTSSDISSTRFRQATYKNVSRSDKRIAFSKLSYGVFEEKHTMINMISMIRINILYLQTVRIKKEKKNVPSVAI